MKLFNLFCKDEKGGGMVEYVLIIVLIAVAAAGTISTLGGKVNTDFGKVSSYL